MKDSTMGCCLDFGKALEKEPWKVPKKGRPKETRKEHWKGCEKGHPRESHSD